MSIDKNNYEIYLIDYFEGNLSPNEVAEVLLFLEQHADIKQEFEGMQSFALNTDEVSLDKSILLKSENDFHQQLLVKEIEGELSMIEKVTLQQAIKQNPALQQEQKLFSLTKSTPDLVVTFNYKDQLLKPTLKVSWHQTIIRIAAVVVLLSTISLLYVGLNKQEKTVAVKKQKSVTPAVKNITIDEPQLATTSPNENVLAEKINPVVNQKQKIATIQKVRIQAEVVSTISAQIEKTNIAIVKPQAQVLPVLAVAKAPTAPQQEQFDDIKTLVAKKVKQNTNQLIGETDTNKEVTLVGIINKTTGADLKINKDTTTGRINRFEIAALGFVWSKK
jgi:hypothetical protein